MKSFVALSALILAVCVVNSQCKTHKPAHHAGNTNINRNTNTNTNTNGDLSSLYDSMSNEDKKSIAGKAVAGKAVVTSRAFPIAPVQQEEVDEVEAPADAEDDFEFAPEQDESVAIPAAQLKFFQSLIAKSKAFQQ